MHISHRLITSLPAKSSAIPSSRWLQIPNQSELFIYIWSWVSIQALPMISMRMWYQMNDQNHKLMAFLTSTIFGDEFFDTTRQRGRIPGSVAMNNSMSARLPIFRTNDFLIGTYTSSPSAMRLCVWVECLCKQHLDRDSINHKGALWVKRNVRSIMKLLR